MYGRERGRAAEEWQEAWREGAAWQFDMASRRQQCTVCAYIPTLPLTHAIETDMDDDYDDDDDFVNPPPKRVGGGPTPARVAPLVGSTSAPSTVARPSTSQRGTPVPVRHQSTR